MMAGTPTDIAEEMEAWYLAGAADGFNLMFPLLPDDWLSFAEIVVPELQRRGLTRKEFMHAGRCGTTSAVPRPQTAIAFWATDRAAAISRTVAINLHVGGHRLTRGFAPATCQSAAHRVVLLSTVKHQR